MTKKRPSRMVFWLKSVTSPDRSPEMPNRPMRTRTGFLAASLLRSSRTSSASRTPPRAMTNSVGEKPRTVKGALRGANHPQLLLCRTARTMRASPAADRTTAPTSRRVRPVTRGPSGTQRMRQSIATTSTTSPAKTRRQVR
ncbi:hypothetical protein BX265_1638 [Streptomyces sp. TLI_235]|nr:hypothetical protein BX265_1638 [Streptomyces sp. TLI_235]